MQKVMMLSNLSSLLFLLFSLAFWLVSGSNIDPSCAKALLRNNTHKRLENFVGYISPDITGEHTDKTYTYKVGICISPDYTYDSTCGIFQYDKFNNGSSAGKPVCIGKITNTQVAETKDHIWTEVTYTGGNSYHSHCGNEPRKGRIVFICDPYVSGKGRFEFMEENRDDDLCYYLFTVASKELCADTFTVGDILLIIFACLIGVWIIAMLIGFLYKRFVTGAKGYEQIPFITYYREFGNLEADGCDLVCRSSNSSPPSRYKPNIPAFTTETDDETDEEKDDNLLPM